MSGTAAEVERVSIGNRMRGLRAWRFAKRLDWREPITVTLRYVHGADPKVEVRARGHKQSFPWDVALLDVLAEVCNRTEGRRC